MNNRVNFKSAINSICISLIITLCVFNIISNVCHVILNNSYNAYAHGVDNLVQPEDDNDGGEISTYSSVEYDSFLEAYYANLTQNMGFNYHGSCGYVALGMLLSYYDTYLNDAIIPEKYDMPSLGSEKNMIERKNSPGILEDSISSTETMVYGKVTPYGLSASEYLSIIKNKANAAKPSLHAKLILIGNELGYYNRDNEEYCSTNINDREAILTEYFKEIGFTARVNFEIIKITGTSSKIEKETRNYIDQGYPVLVSLANAKSGEGHACIAYAHDSNDIYLNAGWTGDYKYARYNDKVFMKDYDMDTYANAMVVKFVNKHLHSDNYMVGDQSYCSCSDEICFYKHEDFYDIDSTYHTKRCACGYISTTESHNYKSYSKISGLAGSLFHNINCTCGASQRERHIFATVNLGNEEYKHCIYCKWSELISGTITSFPDIPYEEYFLRLYAELEAERNNC